jgi:hypothetical protein
MQALNSVGYSHKSLAVAGIGMLIAFLFLAPLASYAAAPTVTVSTDKAFYPQGTETITVSGTVSPAPTSSGSYIGVSITGPTGAQVDANEFAVSTTGAYSGTFTTGGSTYTGPGVYTVTASYNGGTASATFQYGNTTTSTTAPSGVNTTTTVQVTTTVISVVSSVTTVYSSAVTTVSAVAQTTTTLVQAVTTTVSQTGGGSGTAEAIGAVAIIIAIIAAVLAVLAMRKK